MVSITLTGIVDGQEIDAADVTIPLQELEGAINDLIDGNVSFTLIDVNGGAIDGTAIGANVASTGAFTTLSATNGSGIAGLNGSNITLGTIAAARVGVLPASKITSGTLDVARVPDITLAKVTDAGTIASQNANAVNIDGGNIDGTVIGAAAAAAGTFTDLTATGTVSLNGVIDGSVGATDNAVPRANGTGGGTLQASGVVIDDSDNVSGVGRLDTNGNITVLKTGSAQVLLSLFDGTEGWALAHNGLFGDVFTLTRRTGGSTSGGARFQVAQDGEARFFGDALPNVNNTYELGSTSLRWQKIWATDIDSTNAVNVSSDARGKADVRTITPERGLALVLALTPRTFRRNGNPRVHMGFVAQDIESALRRTGNDSLGVVQTNAATGDKSVAYTEIIAAQAAAIQALEARISKLEQKVVN